MRNYYVVFDKTQSKIGFVSEQATSVARTPRHISLRSFKKIRREVACND